MELGDGWEVVKQLFELVHFQNDLISNLEKYL